MTDSGIRTVKSLSADILRRFGRQLDGVSALRARWPALVGEPLGSHSEPQSFEGVRLTVAVRSPAWASRVRQQESGLLKVLRSDPAFRTLREIRVRVEPTDPLVAAPTPARRASRLSPHAARLVRSVAGSIGDPQLRAALERLGDLAADKK